MELKINLEAVESAANSLESRLKALRTDVLQKITDAVGSLEGSWEGSKTAEVYESINQFKANIEKIDAVIASLQANINIYKQNVNEIDTKTTLQTEGGAGAGAGAGGTAGSATK